MRASRASGNVARDVARILLFVLIAWSAMALDGWVLAQLSSLPAGLSGRPLRLLAAINLAAVAGVSVLGLRGLRPLRPVVTVFLAVMLVITGVADVALYAEQRGPSIPRWLTVVPTAAATREAGSLLAAGAADCVTVTMSHISPLAPPYKRCVFDNEVDYLSARPPGNYGYVFHPGAKLTFDPQDPTTVMPSTTVPGGPDSCIRHLEGSWWVTMGEGNPDGKICAAGFLFVEAP